jgi:hypothetical protein
VGLRDTIALAQGALASFSRLPRPMAPRRGGVFSQEQHQRVEEEQEVGGGASASGPPSAPPWRPPRVWAGAQKLSKGGRGVAGLFEAHGAGGGAG